MDYMDVKLTLDRVLPQLIGVLIIIGIFICILGVAFAIYLFFQKMLSSKDIKSILKCCVLGLIFVIIAFLLSSIGKYHVDITSFMSFIPFIILGLTLKDFLE